MWEKKPQGLRAWGGEMADHAVQVYYCLSEDSGISPKDKSLVRLFKEEEQSLWEQI